MPEHTITAHIIEAMSALGYSPHEEGVCYGIAMMAIQAQVRGDFDTFLKRMRFIGGFDFDTPEGIAAFKEEFDNQENAGFYVKPFFDELSVYFGPLALGDFAEEAGLYAEQGPTLAGLHLEGDTDKPYLSSKVCFGCAGNTQLTQDLDQYFTTHSDDMAFEVGISGTHSMAVISNDGLYYLIDHDFIDQYKSKNDLAQSLSKILNEQYSEHPEIEMSSWSNFSQYRSQAIKPSAHDMPGYPSSITQNMYLAVQNREWEVLNYLLAVECSKQKTKDQRQAFNEGCSKLLEEVAHLDDIARLIQCFKDHHVELRPIQFQSVESDLLVKTASAAGGSSTEQGEDQDLLKRVIRQGHVEALRQLIAECGANVEAVDSQDRTALHYAVINGDADIVKTLVKECDASVTALDSGYKTALHYAAIRGHVDIMRILINECGAKVEDFDSKGMTALHWAAFQGHADIVQMLVKQCEANVEAVASSGLTVLHCAARRGHAKIVCELVQRYGADINVCDDQGYTALHFAALGGHIETVYSLVAECDGAVVGERDNEGHTALDFAVFKGHAGIVSVLLKKCSAKDIKAVDFNDRTALHHAVIEGHADIVRLLVNKGDKESLNLTDTEGRTALHLAARENNDEIVRMLINEFEANATAVDSEGHTALHIAALGGHIETVYSLVSECRADVKSVDNLGRTALHHAVISGDADIVKTLVKECGASVEALYCAGFSSDNSEIMDFLEQHSGSSASSTAGSASFFPASPRGGKSTTGGAAGQALGQFTESEDQTFPPSVPP